MADQVHYQIEFGVMRFARLLNVVFYWIALGLAELIVAAVMVETMKVGGLEWIFPVLTAVLIGPVTWLSWRETDRRLYLAVRNGPDGATLFVQRIVHGRIAQADQFERLQGLLWIAGDDDASPAGCVAVRADESKLTIFEARKQPLRDFVIDRAVRDRLAAAVNAQAQNTWQNRSGEPPAQDLTAAVGSFARPPR